MSAPDSRVLVLACGLLLAGFMPAAVSAAEFVTGIDGAPLVDASALDAAGQDPSAASGSAAVLFDFTPRGGGGGLPAIGAGTDAPRLRFEFGTDGGGDGLDALGLGGSTGPSWLEEGAPAGPRRLSLGGALLWSGWSVGGGLARTDLLGGGATDLASATVGYGALTTSLAFGQTGGAAQPSRDVLMLSTDLSAWSWLTFESDLALGDSSAADREAESVAVGRLGVRLNF